MTLALPLSNILKLKLLAKFFYIAVHSLLYNFLRFLRTLYVFLTGGFFNFKRFIYREEMTHFVKYMAWQLRYVFVGVIVRVIVWYGNYFFVVHTRIKHSYKPYGIALYKCAGIQCLAAQNEHVKRVKVVCVCAWNKTVVCRIMGRGI